MTYKHLYDFAQTLRPKISRRELRIKTLELTSIPNIRHVISSMDTSICRGMYLTPQNSLSPVVSALGNHVIVTARDQNYCWERFVYVKELMHVFGSNDQATDSGDKFETLLNELSAPTNEHSPQIQSEYESFWMALSVLCPERDRLAYDKMRRNNEIDDYTIACNLKIPQHYVQRLFEPRYEPIIHTLLSRT